MGWLGCVARTALAVALGLVSAGTAAAQTEKRVALVIGNAAYKEWPLLNPLNDARAMSARLRQLGFEVVMRENATRAHLASAIAEFAAKITPTSVALFYYAGHGIQVRGRNYLIPVDATIEAESSVPFTAIDVTQISEAIDQTGARAKLMVMDACRNNPFEGRLRGAGAGRGLAPMDAARGSLVAYATAPGSVAADGDGANSIYTGALLKALAEPGLKAEDVFKRARLIVLEQTRGAQTPWEQSALTGDLVLNRAPIVAAVGAAGQADRETVFWQSAQTSNRAAEYEAYLKQYPQGAFAALALARVAALKFQLPTASGPAQFAVPAKPDIAVEPIDREYVATQTARLREAPDVNSKQLATLKEGDMLLVLGKVKDQPWLQVEREGEPPAYVSVGLVEEGAVYKRRMFAESQQQISMLPNANPPSPATANAPEGPFRDCATCPEMIVVPGGKFTMGSPANEAGRSDIEGPQHTVTVRKFAAGKYEVTFAEWDACESAGGCTRHAEDGGWGRGNRPVINVSWDDAKQYAAWLSRRTGKQYRLLSEAEWEYAARAGTTTAFHTGATITPAQANFAGDGMGVYEEQTANVGRFAPNKFGLHDMHGNVWEWVEDCFNASYAEAPTNGAAWTSGDCSKRVVRGGSWSNFPGGIRSAFRSKSSTSTRYNNYGFRVARTE